jgi:hypothetical protein
VLSKQFMCANPTWVSSCFLLLDFTWILHKIPPPRGDSTSFGDMVSHDGASRSHLLDTPHSIELLWASDQPEAETCTWKHSIYQRQISMLTAVFELTIPASERPQTPHFRLRGHWDWLV